MLSWMAAAICLLCAWAALSGCLYSTHQYHTGLLLPQGRTQATFGAGRQPLWRCESSTPDTTGAQAQKACNEDENRTEKVSPTGVFKGSVDYRLGVRDSWGPFPGVELQWHLEVPTNPASMEFTLNLGLPIRSAAFRHMLGAGWGIGAWADNSYFLHYALSRDMAGGRIFGNIRATWLATQIGEVMGGDFAMPFPSDQHIVFQSGAGYLYRLPDWPVAPDFLIPFVNLTLPAIPGGDKKFRRQDIPLLQADASLGVGWGF